MQESKLCSFADIYSLFPTAKAMLVTVHVQYVSACGGRASVEFQAEATRLLSHKEQSIASDLLQITLSFFMFENDMCKFAKSSFTKVHFYHVCKHNIYTPKTCFGDIDWCPKRISYM